MRNILQLLPVEEIFQEVSIVPEGGLVKQPGEIKFEWLFKSSSSVW